MCGFVGVFSKKLLKKNHINSLNKMNKIISHRGPDSKGLYCVKNYAAAFSRLSIIDVNKRSDQPFNSKDKRYSLVYNGEIYNFKKLNSEI
jgi:asparagine synthase (glutamine-hydrolysing)